jgi:hypothetical protein
MTSATIPNTKGSPLACAKSLAHGVQYKTVSPRYNYPNGLALPAIRNFGSQGLLIAGECPRSEALEKVR